MCKNINTAAATYKHQQKVNKKEQQQQQSKYGSQATGSAQQAKKQTEGEKRARLRHVATQRKRAMETLVLQEKKRKKLSLSLKVL